MKNQLVYLFFALILFSNCENPVKKSDKIFAEQADTIIGKDITFLNSTIEFLYYANPTNYWYPEEYTFKDILNDHYRHGYKGLKRLDQSISSIVTDDTQVQTAIDELEKQILAAQKDIKEKQSAIENLNGFGGMAFGGVSGLMDFGNALSSEEERKKTEEKGRAMPEKVKVAFDDLIDLLIYKFRNVATNMNALENKAFEISKPNNEEKNQIRYNLKLFVRSKINQQFNSKDTTSRDEMVKQLFDYYDKEFSLSSINKTK
jgi:hypothetical protein